MGFLTPAPKPAERVFLLRAGKMTDLRLDEVSGDLWREGQEAAVAYHGDLLDFPVMLPDELQMREQCREVLPTRKRLGVEQDPVQLAVGFDVRIHDPGHGLEVGRREAVLRAEDQDPLRFPQLMFDHCATPLPTAPTRGRISTPRAPRPETPGTSPRAARSTGPSCLRACSRGPGSPICSAPSGGRATLGRAGRCPALSR